MHLLQWSDGAWFSVAVFLATIGLVFMQWISHRDDKMHGLEKDLRLKDLVPDPNINDRRIWRQKEWAENIRYQIAKRMLDKRQGVLTNSSEKLRMDAVQTTLELFGTIEFYLGYQWSFKKRTGKNLADEFWQRHASDATAAWHPVNTR